MSEPALKIATDYVRLALANFSLGWTPDVERDLLRRDLTLTDLANALRCCQVLWTDKESASDALFVVLGDTTEGHSLELAVTVQPDCRRLVVKGIV